MTFVNPFRVSGRWFRGNTHTHSTQSDGQLSVAQRFAAYRERGYDFLVLTDHGKVSDVSAFSDKDFVAISGSELHPENPLGGSTYHLVALDLSEPVDVAGKHPNDVVAEVAAQGGHVVIAHPYWCGHTLLDLLPLEGCFGVEVYNDTCGGIGKSDSEVHWDDLLDRGRRLVGIACDDAHGTEHDCYHGWVMVKSDSLDCASVMKALLTGCFYSSTGPEIHDLVLVEDEVQAADGTVKKVRKVMVQTSPARAIIFKAQRYYGRRYLAPEGGLLESAAFTLSGAESYVRVEVIDAQGHKAWTNPLFFDPA